MIKCCPSDDDRHFVNKFNSVTVKFDGFVFFDCKNLMHATFSCQKIRCALDSYFVRSCDVIFMFALVFHFEQIKSGFVFDSATC